MSYRFYEPTSISQCPFNYYHGINHHVCYNQPVTTGGCVLGPATISKEQYLAEVEEDVQELYRRPATVSGHVITSSPRNGCCISKSRCFTSNGFSYDSNTNPIIPCVVTTSVNKNRGSPASSVGQRENPFWHHRKSDVTVMTDTCCNRVRPVPENFREKFIRRHPVTFRTSKYVRRPGAALLKKPSTLSLKLAYQPDPAFVRQPSRRHIFQKINSDKFLSEHKEMSSKLDTDIKERNPTINSEGDHLSTVDSLEKIAVTLDMEDNYLSQERKEEIRKLSKLITPRVPSSIKKRQEEKTAIDNSVNKSDSKEPANVSLKSSNDQMSVKSIPKMEQTLETLLDHLKRCELACTVKDEKMTAIVADQAKDQAVKAIERNREINQIPSFNLQDLYRHMPKSFNEFNKANGIRECTPPSREYTESEIEEPGIANRASFKTFKFDASTKLSYQNSLNGSSKHTSMDDNAALELHRSKSYIVNLIDRALSKELGTVSNDKCNKREFEKFSTSKAINLVDRYYKIKKSNNNDDFTQALEKSSMTNNLTASESKQSQYSLETEEPAYIRQLKDLRWGHFRHIQQEVKRLEDLERFLDSCGVTTTSF